ncbi:MAG: four helix bundle protein [Clostridia bacterium]|nr:four helix bundle protein [Clostridia bacterium]
MVVWKKAHELVLEIYNITKDFPIGEKYRLTDQLCRAVSSIAMNICEGTGRKSKKDFVHFLYISRGSLQETKYQLLLAKDLGIINKIIHDSLDMKCSEVGKLLNALINRLENE